MGATITLKNIPGEVYDSLKKAAEMHRRSINSEAIACFERVLLPAKVGQAERLARARQLRANLDAKRFKVADIAKAIEQGRP